MAFAAAYTENGTWGVGLAHTASWKKDRIRYTGAVGYAHVVSTFYLNDQPADFELDTALLLQDVKFRIGSSNIFVGGKLVYLTPELLFDDDIGRASQSTTIAPNSTISVLPCRLNTMAGTTR